MVGSTGHPFSSIIGNVDLESLAIATQFLHHDDDQDDDDDIKGDDDNWWYCGNCGPEWLFDPKCQLWRGQNGTETLHPPKS